MTVATVSLSILNRMDIHLVENRKENCHHDLIPFNLKGNGLRIFSMLTHQPMQIIPVIPGAHLAEILSINLPGNCRKSTKICLIRALNYRLAIPLNNRTINQDSCRIERPSIFPPSLALKKIYFLKLNPL